MKCYNCGSFLYESEYCSSCGCDVSVYKKIVGRSNQMYNKGLEYARARNLTRAVEYLEVSLRMYKGNVNARNLLGLVYVEMGEYTKGLAQWVVSKSIQSDNELADLFLSKLQKNQTYLEKMQSSIKKYNRALTYIRQGDHDLAEVQLRKLLNDDKKFIKGFHLLALLLIRQKEYEKAKTALTRAMRVDRGNPTTISYMSFVDAQIKEEEKTLPTSEVKTRKKAREGAEEESKPLSGDDVIIPPRGYKESSPATLTIIQILIGIVIGAAIVFFVVTPAKMNNATSELETEIVDYQQQITELESELEEINSQEEDADALIAEYELLLSAVSAWADKDFDAALEYIESITMEEEIGGTFQELCEMIENDDSDSQAQEIADEVYSTYLSRSYGYTTSEELLLEAYELSPYNESVLYYLGIVYYHLYKYEEGAPYLQSYVEIYPDGEYITEVNELLADMGY